MRRKNSGRAEIELGDDDADALDLHDLTTKKRRVIDWKQPLVYPIQIAFIGLTCWAIAEFGIRSSGLAVAVALATILAVPASFIVPLLGVVFDPEKGELNYPVYVWRRRIPLRAIHAANCQNVTTKTNTSQFTRTIGEKGKTIYSRAYYVNLSGDFESRRLIFGSKYKRDQFLTYLRAFVPTCRITRWT